MDQNLTNALVGGMANSLLASLPQNNNNVPLRTIITVNGVDEARSFALNKGESIALIDESDDIFYIKECDDIGKISLKAYRYEEIELTQAAGGVSRKEFDALKDDISEIKKLLTDGNNGKFNSQQSKE